MRNSKLLTLATLVAQCISIVGAAAIAVASPNTLKKVPLRVFIDVTAPEAAVAWSRLRRQAPRAKFQWLVHPLPLVANQNSHLSAAKVLYARRHSRALDWIDALLMPAKEANTSRAKSWRSIGLSAPSKAQLKALANDVERERRAAIRFGVRAAPSLLWCGLPESGVSTTGVVQATQALLRWQACERRGQPDCELHHVRRESLAAAVTLQQLRRLTQRSASSMGIGTMGPLWRVKIPAQLRPKRRRAPVTIVWFVDPIRVNGLRQSTALLQEMDRGRLEVVILPLSRAGASIEPSARLLSLLRQGDERTRRTLIRRLIAKQGTRVSTTHLFLRDDATSSQALTRKHVTLLHQIASIANEVDARPSDVFINGRRWLGGAEALGLDQGVQIASRAPLSRAPYAQRIAHGRWLGQGQRDLGPRLHKAPFESLIWLRRRQGATRPISLLFDPAQWMSRAAYYAVLNLSREHKVGIRIGMVGAAAGDAYKAQSCNVLAKWLDSIVAGKPQRLSRCRGAHNAAGAAAMAALATELGAGQEPVIYFGRRRYLGPLDENRIRHAFEEASSTR